MSHLAYDDPIVFPGRPGASHLHMFFGNTGADAWSTFASLRTTGGSSCQGGPANRSAYWAPAVLDVDGDVLMPDFVSVYYKGPARHPDGTLMDVEPLPPGLRMIAGDDMTQPDDWGHFEWNCESTPRKRTTIPSCPSGERIGIVLAFPTCWDGVHLDSADHRSHMAYGQRDTSSGVVSCPASHPVPIPEFTVGIWFPNDGASQDWYLSSDRMNGMVHPNGSTFHSDWFGAWDPDVRDTWTEACINELRNCSGGSLGDGRQLVAATDYRGPSKVPAPPR